MGYVRLATARGDKNPAYRADSGRRNGVGVLKKSENGFPKHHFRPCSDLP